jgi:hypothetical protein
MNLLSILTIVQLCPLLLASDCQSGACIKDETSLMQFSRSLDVGAHSSSATPNSRSRLAWRSEKAAVATEWKAHRSAANVQKKLMAAAAAGLEGEAAIALQERNDTVDVTLNMSGVEAVENSAAAAVNGAEMAVDQALSDEKRADAAASIAAFASEKAAWAKKASEVHADAAVRKAQAAQQHAAHMARLAKEAQEKVKQTEFNFNLSNASNATAALKANITENLAYQQAAAARDAAKTLTDAKQNYSAALAKAQREAIIADANATLKQASADANDAAMARAVAAVDANFSASASKNYTNSSAFLKEAHANASAAAKLASQAESAARKATNAYYNTARKAAALTNMTATQPTEVTDAELEVKTIDDQTELTNQPAAELQ